MLSDLIKVFKETYKTYNKKKLDAKICLEFFKDLLDDQSKRSEQVDKLNKILLDTITIVPYHAYVSFYNKALNYLKYGDDVKYHEDGTYSIPGYTHGFKDFMKDLTKFLNVEYDIAKGFYKDKNYDACIERIKKAIETYNSRWKDIDKEHNEVSQVQLD